MVKHHEDHVTLTAIWAYHADKIALTAEKKNHLYQCNECLALLGLCQVSDTIQEVRNRARRRGIQVVD
jgi:hypothetical protein